MSTLRRIAAALVGIPLLWAFVLMLAIVATYRAVRGLPAVEAEGEE